MSYENLDIEDSIAITGLIDFTKTQRTFIAEYVQEACNTDTISQATINKGDGFTAEKRRRAIKRYATTALEQQQRSVIVQDMIAEIFEAKKVG